MKHILAITLQRLHHEEHFEFLRQVIALVQVSPDVVKTAVGDALPMLEALEQREDAALEFYLSKKFTKEMQEQDIVRDRYYTALRMLVGAYSHCAMPYEADAADLIQVVIDHYGNVTRYSLNEETGVLHNLVQDLRVKCGNELPVFGANKFVDALDKANKDFEVAMAGRVDYEAIMKEDRIPMPLVRKEVDEVYQLLVARIEGSIALSPSDGIEFRDFVFKLNERIQYYRETVKQRVAAAKRIKN